MTNSNIDQAALENIYVYTHTYVGFVLKTIFFTLHTNLQMNLAKGKFFAVGKAFNLMHWNHLSYSVKYKLCAYSYVTLSHFLQTNSLVAISKLSNYTF